MGNGGRRRSELLHIVDKFSSTQAAGAWLIGLLVCLSMMGMSFVYLVFVKEEKRWKEVEREERRERERERERERKQRMKHALPLLQTIKTIKRLLNPRERWSML